MFGPTSVSERHKAAALRRLAAEVPPEDSAPPRTFELHALLLSGAAPAATAEPTPPTMADMMDPAERLERYAGATVDTGGPHGR